MKNTVRTLILALGTFAMGTMASAQSTNGSYGTQQAQESATQSTNSSTTSVRISSGTEIQVRVNERLSSDKSVAGDRFTGTLAAPVNDSEGRTAFERGASVSGRVLDAKPSGRLSDSGELELTILQISGPSGYVNVNVQPFPIKGVSHTKSNTAKIGGGAVLGAIIGGIAGGGKGAAIGTVAGAGAGTAGAAATGKREAIVEPEAVLRFALNSDTTVHMGQVQESNPELYKRGTGDQGDRPILEHRPTADNHQTAQNNSSVSANGSNTGTGAGNPASANSNTSSNAGTVNTTTAASASVPTFTLRDKRVIGQCLSANSIKYARYLRAEPVPAGTSLAKGSVLPTAIEEKAHPMPLECNQQLSTLPDELERVIYNRRVMLLDANGRVLDAFNVPAGH